MKRAANGSNGRHNGPLSVGLVGLGYWGPNLLRVLAELPGVEVRWTCDLEPERLERFARRYPAVRRTTDVELLFHDDGLDALLFATPVFTHFDLAAGALRSGKHTFVEKPLASSTAMAQALLDLAEREQLVLMCGHTFLYSPPVCTVKELMRRQELGEIFFISSSRVNLGLHQRDVSVVWDLAPHDFSILLYWLEEMPVSVRAVGRDSIVPGVPDVAFVTLTYSSGLVANVELSWLAPSKLRRTVVVGSEKMVVYDEGTVEPVRVFNHGVVYRDPETFGEYHLSYRTGDILSPKLDSYEPLARELEDFTQAVRSHGTTVAGGRLARDVVRLTEAADESLRRGGKEVAVSARARAPSFANGRSPHDSRPGRTAGVPLAREQRV
jgi:predicted dehydrogenase